jgi:murein DD-endopeptidase MepM/ murein hydrolase activator NlpD
MKRISSSLSQKRLGLPLVVAGLVSAMVVAGLAGAWLRAHWNQPATLGEAQQRAIVDLAKRNSNYIRGNVDQLASRVGDLQARLIEIEGLGRRVAKAADVSYTDPEIQASLASMRREAADGPAPYPARLGSSEGLGRELDALQQQIALQKDRFAMLDLALTRRAAVEASLPTYSPVNYPALSSSFGWRQNPVTGRYAMHDGLDFSAPRGTPIRAASGGVVTEAGAAGAYGKMVEINHGNGFVTRYAHASQLDVNVGDIVEKGQLIGNVGSTGRSTGPHLHFEVRLAGHPLNPDLFLVKAPSASTTVADASKQVNIMTEVR